MLKRVLLTLLVSLVLNPFTICVHSIERDSVYFENLNKKFEKGTSSVKSSVINFYIDSIGVSSNELLKFMTVVAMPMDFSKNQKDRLFDSASTKFNDTKILAFLNYFRDKSYVPIVKEWYEKSDKRGRFLYESLLFEFGDKDVDELWTTTLRNCSKVVINLPPVMSQYFPVVCGKFPQRKYCDLVIDFMIDHQNQYFVNKDYTGVTEFDDVVYYLSFFLADRVKGFPDPFSFKQYMRTSEKGRTVAFSKADKDVIIRWCKVHRRDYEFVE